MKIVDHKTRVTRNLTSNFYKVQWSNHSEREATWETEEFLKTNYPEFLATHQGTQLTPPSAFQFNVRTPNLGYSGRGFSTSIIWSSGPHNHLNRKYHTLSLPSLSLSPVTSLSLTSLTSSPSPLSPRFRNLSFQLDSKAKGASLGVGDHLLQVFHLGATSFSSFLARGTSSRY